MQASAFTDDGMSRAESPTSHTTVRTNNSLKSNQHTKVLENETRKIVFATVSKITKYAYREMIQWLGTFALQRTQV